MTTSFARVLDNLLAAVVYPEIAWPQDADNKLWTNRHVRDNSSYSIECQWCFRTELVSTEVKVLASHACLLSWWCGRNGIGTWCAHPFNSVVTMQFCSILVSHIHESRIRLTSGHNHYLRHLNATIQFLLFNPLENRRKCSQIVTSSLP